MFDYTCARWRRLRASVLREAKYQCQIARRYGRMEEATRVHHIWPVEDYPEFAWCRWNLIAVSLDAHRRLHKPDGSLSTEGDALRRRTRPPRCA